MEKIVNRLQGILPAVKFIPGKSLHWSPTEQTITFRASKTKHNMWALLHEAGHAKLNHVTYNSDVELLLLEATAWNKAETLAKEFNEHIDPEYIQDCLDTYRDWLHQRSTCPRCGIVSFQESISNYRCYNCHKIWSVTASRLCRPYRLDSDNRKNRRKKISQTVFQVRSTI